jgi:exopolyphosphatase/guanosine-5'-triphosphate,3'-diphosphate pyrophosphatase
VRGACIDIGSNTTRLLVADCDGTCVSPVAEERVFTHIRDGRNADGTLTQAKIDEVAQVVSDQLRRAHELGATQIRAVATAGIRRAANSAALSDAIGARCGLEVDILTGEEEARLAFVGAANALGAGVEAPLGVVDVGGGSCELVVGRPPDLIDWCSSYTLGSSDLTVDYLHSDPPTDQELATARARIEETFADLQAPQPASAVAVGGSATSLGRVAGSLLDEHTFERALAMLTGERAIDFAHRHGLVADRVRLLPAGLLILQSAAGRLGRPLAVGAGGIREGVLLEGCRDC